MERLSRITQVGQYNDRHLDNRETRKSKAIAGDMTMGRRDWRDRLKGHKPRQAASKSQVSKL